MMPDTEPYIFISYSNHDRLFVDRLVTMLEAHGLPVFRMTGINPGQYFGQVVQERVPRCAVFVPVLSPTSTLSDWVYVETMLALRTRRAIVPLLLRGGDLFDEVRQIHAVRVVGDRVPPKLVELLRGYVVGASGPEGGDPVHTVPDITRAVDLVRFAVHARILSAHQTPATVARALQLGETGLDRYLAGRAPFGLSLLRQIDDALIVLGGRPSGTGGLTQFAVRMSDSSDGAVQSGTLSLNWAEYILGARAGNELHLLLQASTLIDIFSCAEDAGARLDVVEERYRREIGTVVDQLILVTIGPPSARYMEAQTMLARLATYAFNLVMDRLNTSVRQSPLGFRTWRAITRLVTTARSSVSDPDDTLPRHLPARLTRLVADMERLRRQSIYPGRSLDLELLVGIPKAWSPGEVDPVDHALRERAENPEATLRERGTAAMGLWQRAVENGVADDPHLQDYLSGLADAFEGPDARADIAEGLAWVATTLRQAMAGPVAVCNDFPHRAAPWYAAVEDATASLEPDVDEPIRAATTALMRHVLLQNAGVERRRAIDTISAGDLAEPVARALADLLQDDRVADQAWLRIRALFALGFMQSRIDLVEGALVLAVQQGYEGLVADRSRPADVTELQTALFAIGDVYGVVGAEEDAARIRTHLSRELTGLAGDLTHRDDRTSVARATAYLLTFTAQPRSGGVEDLSQELLRTLADHDDSVTRTLARWALAFRFGPDGGIRPLLSALP